MILKKLKSITWPVALLMSLLAFGLAVPETSFAASMEETDYVHVTLAQASGEEAVNDPLESMNRMIFEFNEGLQDVLLRPIAKFYNANVNLTVRLGISNFLYNLSSPVIFANDLLQGEFERALTTFGRAFINTTIGIVGLADVASELGAERHNEDFGQTLAVYGVGEGFYLVLPIFGPSSPRDAIGKLVIDSYLDPLGLWLDNTDRQNIEYTLAGAEGLDEYAGIVDELNQVKKTSVDYYAAVRSLYRQKRKTEIHNGSILELPPIPDLSYGITPPELSYGITPEDFDQPLAGVSPPAPQ
jgi:phospholipid-binding lipoprotein MlaA